MGLNQRNPWIYLMNILKLNSIPYSQSACLYAVVLVYTQLITMIKKLNYQYMHSPSLLVLTHLLGQLGLSSTSSRKRAYFLQFFQRKERIKQKMTSQKNYFIKCKSLVYDFLWVCCYPGLNSN